MKGQRSAKRWNGKTEGHATAIGFAARGEAGDGERGGGHG